ncbi:hypothetical protein J4219_02965 [Candidatus Woesearchaeota archaeon]|nr:hypothetical protein [Candidatus Woesearchaeota archaeon]
MDARYDKYVTRLIEDGEQSSDAVRRLENMLSMLRPIFSSVGNQIELEAKMCGGLEYLLEGFPALCEEAPFSVDLRAFLNRTMVSASIPAKPVMRYFEFWQEVLTLCELKEMVRSMMQDEQHSGYSLALYADKVFRTFDHNFVREVVQHVCEKKWILPVLTVVPYMSLSSEFREESDKWFVQDSVLKTERVSLLRGTHADRGIGTCKRMKEGHISMIDKNSDKFGSGILLYVGGNLIGVMKTEGGPSILGLQYVQSASGRWATVIGGVYATTEEVTAECTYAWYQNAEKKKWTKMSLKELPLCPLTMIGDEKYYKGSQQYSDVLRIKEFRETLVKEGIVLQE